MASTEPYIGQRRSYGGALCTIRYIGPLANTKGDWLGVEWDDVSRGKHDGQHGGYRIFHCLSPAPTAASFIRPSRKPDVERTVLEAIKFKYAATTDSAHEEGPTSATETTIEISGKVVEEVGFDKIQRQLSVLTELKIVLVDELVVCGIAPRGASREDVQTAQVELGKTCPNIVELDIGWNVIETWQDIVDICVPLKKLKILKGSGLRLREFETRYIDGGGASSLTTVEELQMNECLLKPAEIVRILSSTWPHGYVSLKTLSLALNELETFTNTEADQGISYPSVTAVNLDNNKFSDLSSLPMLMSMFPNMHTLSLQGNQISHLGLGSSTAAATQRFDKVETLNLARNQISDYSFVDALARLCPNLTSLRISGNPVYDQAEPTGANDNQQSKAAAASDSRSYYLTLARIPHLKSLNYTTITPRDRDEGEIYYLSTAEREIKQILDSQHTNNSLSPDQRVDLARRKHPLYSPLCAKHDRDDILDHFLQTPENTAALPNSAFESYAPGTLGSRLVDTYFYIQRPSRAENCATSSAPKVESASFRRLLPSTISVYRLKSLVSKQFNLPALQFKLVYESHEYDPVEPISRTTVMGGEEEDWDAWGDWDVDHETEHDLRVSQQQPNKTTESLPPADGERGPGSYPGTLGQRTIDIDDIDTAPMYISRDGQRFKKRETEILDGMRPWGDFLDLDAPDGSRRRDARIRIEPFRAVALNQ